MNGAAMALPRARCPVECAQRLDRIAARELWSLLQEAEKSRVFELYCTRCRRTSSPTAMLLRQYFIERWLLPSCCGKSMSLVNRAAVPA